MRLDDDPRLPVNGSYVSFVPQFYKLWRQVSTAVNAMLTGSIDGRVSSATMPAGGTWKKGDFVWKSDPVEAGSASSKYVIVGWVRLTDGSAHVANTDWVPCRFLTGN